MCHHARHTLTSRELEEFSLQMWTRGRKGAVHVPRHSRPLSSLAALQSILALGAVSTHLMDAKVGIGVKVVVFGCHVLSIGLLTTFCLATGNLEEGEWQKSQRWVPQSLLNLHKAPHHSRSALQPLQHLSFPTTCFHFQDPPRAPSREQPPRLPSLQALGPVSSSAHSWGGRERGQSQGRHMEGQGKRAGDGVKEAAMVLGSQLGPGRTLS